MSDYQLVRIGSNIHPVYPVAPQKAGDPWTTRAYSAEEKLERDRFLIESNASANLMMNDIDEARRIAAMVPNSDTIFRLYNKDVEGALWKAHTPESYCHGMKGYYDDRLILNIGNEPLAKLALHELDELKRSVDFYVGVMRLMWQSGQRATLPAWSSGSPEFFYFTDDRYWNVLKPMFEAFREYPTNTLNMHSYFNKYGLGYGNGHIGRHETVANLIADRMNGFIPDMYITEYGADKTADTPGPWQEVFGANDVGETRYAEMLTLGPIKAFHQRYVKGLIAFCFAAYPEWRLYDFSKAKIVKAAIINYNRNAPIINPTPPPPTPQPESWATGVAVTVLTGAVIRFQADVSSKVLLTIHNSDIVQYDRNYAVEGWYKVRKGTVTGYASKQFLTDIILGELPAPNPNPVPQPLPPSPPQSEIDIIRIAQHTETIAVKQAEIMALEAEISAILAKWLPNAA